MLTQLIPKEALDNPIIKTFVSEKENQNLLLRFLKKPSSKDRKAIDERFKEHFRVVKILSYFSKYIYYFSINFDKKERKIAERHMIILDKSIDDEENMTLLDTLAIVEPFDYLTNSKNIEDYIENVEIIKKIRCLSQNQKDILSMSYIDGLKDKEIAEILCVSQQAVSKARNKALEKLRRS